MGNEVKMASRYFKKFNPVHDQSRSTMYYQMCTTFGLVFFTAHKNVNSRSHRIQPVWNT